MKKSVVITLDGPSGAGKSTVARAVARKLRYRYLDTGAMYRTVALAVLRAGLTTDPPNKKEIGRLLEKIKIELGEGGRVLLNGKEVESEIRSEEVTAAVSAVSALPAVRKKMVALQRAFALEGPLVVEGRDTGTVVFPESPRRFFLDADLKTRTRRRILQQEKEGWSNAPQEVVIRDLEGRDRKDSERRHSPLIREGLEVIDTTDMSFDEVVETILKRVQQSRRFDNR